MHFTSACRFIEARREDSGLTADAIARAIGCSRASLYRLFEQRGLAVAEHVRAVRLNHSRTLLRDPRLGIGDIALRCGYDDLSAFGKASTEERRGGNGCFGPVSSRWEDDC